jgi:xanthine dehydrogenase accessory factor
MVMTPSDLLQLTQQLASRQEPYAVVTVVRIQAPTSAYVGAQAIVCSDGSLHGWIGGGCARRIVVEAALEAIGQGTARLLRISNDSDPQADEIETHRMTCASNGEIELFIHPFGAAPLVLILGDTPVAAAARVFAQATGFRVSAGSEGAEPHVALVATMGEGDVAALERALAGTAKRVLLIASARKAQKLRKLLLLRGVTDEQLARLDSPAGPDIGARTPAEIALAAIAGTIAWWRGAQRQAATSTRSRPASRPALERLPQSNPRSAQADPVCGMVVDPANAVHVVDYEGTRFYFCCDGCKLQFERDPAKLAAVRADLSGIEVAR